VNRTLLILAISLLASACGKEPTSPSSTSIAGQWRSSDRVLYITNIRLTLIEPTPGVITGKWTADGRTDNVCSAGVPCGDSSVVSGRNEAGQVVLDMLGAGTFVGVLYKHDSLSGIVRNGTNYHVTFGRQP
jgi:hypothetical protein